MSKQAVAPLCKEAPEDTSDMGLAALSPKDALDEDSGDLAMQLQGSSKAQAPCNRAEDAGKGAAGALAAKAATDEEEAKIAIELSRLFECDAAEEDEIVLEGDDDVVEDGYEAAAAEQLAGEDDEILFEDEDEAGFSEALPGDEKDEGGDGPGGGEGDGGQGVEDVGSEAESDASSSSSSSSAAPPATTDGTSLLDLVANAGQAPASAAWRVPGEGGRGDEDAGSDTESDASSSSSSSSAAPGAISDGTSLLDLVSTAGGPDPAPAARRVPAANGSGPHSAAERALEIKLTADLGRLPKTGRQRAGRFRQLSQWVRGKGTSEGFAGTKLSKAQVEALLSRVSKRLGGLPVPPAVAASAGVQGAGLRSKAANGQVSVGVGKHAPKGALVPSDRKPDSCNRPGFAVPRHRDLPPPGRSSLSGGRRRPAGRGGPHGSVSFEEDADALARVFGIVSHRYNDLWFENPGQHVACNWCGDEFSQACGRLQGADGRSQFAQNQFVCHPCLQTAGEMELEGE